MNMYLLIKSIALTMTDLHRIYFVCFLWVLRPFISLWWPWQCCVVMTRQRVKNAEEALCSSFLSFYNPSTWLLIFYIKCNMGPDVAFSFILRKHRYQGFQNKTSVMSLSLKSRVWTLNLLDCWHFDRLLSCGITCINDQCAKVARPRSFSRTSTSRQEQSRRKGLVQYCAGTKKKMTRFRIM